MANNFEKKNYTVGDAERQRIAEARAEALRTGKILEFEELENMRRVAQGGPAPERKKVDYKAGDPEKLKAARERMAKLYPPKPDAKNLEIQEDKAA